MATLRQMDRQTTFEMALWAISNGPIEIENFNRRHEPVSSDFRDGWEAEGWWINDDHSITEQVAGSSGVYLIEYNATGETVSDNRPWQMRM